ncbi:hypothetical protein [Rhizobium etli]|nr:hypothetical protein [Rhizobium etli]
MHIPFGLMERSQPETPQSSNTQALEDMTGKKVPTDIADDLPKRGSDIVLLRFRTVGVMRGACGLTVPRCTPVGQIKDSRAGARIIALQPHHWR